MTVANFKTPFSPVASWKVDGVERRLLCDDFGFYAEIEVDSNEEDHAGKLWMTHEVTLADLVSMLGYSGHVFAATAKMADRAIELEFEELWKVYANWNKKADAKKLYIRLRKKKALPPIDRLCLIVSNMKQGKRLWLQGYQPHMTTWLRARGWEDGQDAPKGRLIHGEFYER